MATHFYPAPNIDHLTTEDDTPVDSIFSGKQHRLLVEPLRTSWKPGRPYMAASFIGLFYDVDEPPLVPDVFLSLDVKQIQDMWIKEGRSYFTWIYGKPPEVVIEVVDYKDSGELTHKFQAYERLGVPYYAVYDPRSVVQAEALVVFEQTAGKYAPRSDTKIPAADLELRIWQGTYEQMSAPWLRWALPDGELIQSGEEIVERIRFRQRAEQERQRAEQAEVEAANLRARLREAGIDPNSI